MRLLTSLFAGLLASYLALVWATGHLDAVSVAACGTEFSGPDIVCRVAALGVTLLAVPAAGLVAFIATLLLWRRRTRADGGGA